MEWPTIHKSPGVVPPNLEDDREIWETFSWAEARRELDGLPGGGLNIAHEAVSRHVLHGRGDHVALRWRGRRGDGVDITYEDLDEASNRFAAVLAHLGLGRGDLVALLLTRVPDLYAAVLGTLKNASVVSALFPAFGPEPVRQRLELGDARVLVTTEHQYRRKIAGLRGALPRLDHVLLSGEVSDPPPPGTVALQPLMEQADGSFDMVPTDPEDLALLHFTSGTTGMPKAAMHVHEAVVAHHTTGRFALDLHPDDVYWCTADPGWVTGMSYGIIAPLTNGVTLVVDEGEFEASRWYSTLEHEAVNVWYTAPTALRMLQRASADAARGHDLSALRFVASVGEPLNPEVIDWFRTQLDIAVHDNWWQTETGGIMIANVASTDIKPGSMGRPLPGIDVAILERDPSTTGHPWCVTVSPSKPMWEARATWPSARDGRRCSVATCTSASATNAPSSATGTSPATWPDATTTATSGSWAEPTTSSSRRATSSGPSRWRARSSSTRRSSRPGSSARRTRSSERWSRPM